ncbi:hypothetical protein D9M68_429130 [compost metagenome]
MQLEARRVDVVHARRLGLPVDREQHMGELHRRAGVVDARQRVEIALAAQCRQRGGHGGARHQLRGRPFGLWLVLLLVVRRLARELRAGRRGRDGHRAQRQDRQPCQCRAVLLLPVGIVLHGAPPSLPTTANSRWRPAPFFARQPRYVACVDWPHCAQNFAPGAIAVPHCRQAAGSIDVPHCWQKRAPAAFTARQAGQALPPGGGGGTSRPYP